MFWRNVVPLVLFGLLDPWRWRHTFPSKCQGTGYPVTQLHISDERYFEPHYWENVTAHKVKLVLFRCCPENQRLCSQLYMSVNTGCVLQFLNIDWVQYLPNAMQEKATYTALPQDNIFQAKIKMSFRLQSSGMWCSAFWQIVTSVAGESALFLIRMNEWSRFLQRVLLSNQTTGCHTPGDSLHSEFYWNI